MRLLSMALLSLALLGSAACTQEQELPPYSKVYDTNRDAQADFAFAIERAKKSQKRILMFVGGDWCIWCRALDVFLQNTPAVHDLLQENFVLLKVYYGRDNRNTKFLAGLPPFRGTPHFYVFDAEGQFLHTQPTEVLEQGQGYDALKMTTFLQKWATEEVKPQAKPAAKPS